MMMPNQMIGMLNQLKQNPAQFLMQMRFNVPQGVNMNDANSILNHLVSTNQVSQQQVNNAYQMMQKFR